MRQHRAIVIGGSMAGLTAARILSDHCDEVILLERDEAIETGVARSGVPQGKHAHGLLTSGLQALEGFFPGLAAAAVAHGGRRVDHMRDICRCFAGGEQIRFASGVEALCLSRPLLEGLVRERLREIPNIRLREGCAVRGLVATCDNSRVAGVKTDDGMILGSLVVDASGRGSRSPAWLEAMGYSRPVEERIEVGITYVTRLFRRLPHDLNGAAAAAVGATPSCRRGGIAVARERDTWTVTLYAYGQDAPATLGAFIGFAGTLQAPHIHEIVARAEPIGEATIMRFPASTRRRYEAMRRFPEGYLVVGDAVCSFNPVYGQGMSVAALEAVELDKALRHGPSGLAHRFFRQIAKVVDTPWRIAAGSDLRLCGSKGTLMSRGFNWYLARLLFGARHDPELALAFQNVAALLRPPRSLLAPRTALRVLSANLTSRRTQQARFGLAAGDCRRDAMPER